ncbi:MAG: transcription elongation factor GreA [Chlamydiales bacterium]
MSYVEEFRERIENGELDKAMQLWEEYSNGDQVDPDEFKEILILIKNSEFAESFGPYAETALPLWSQIQDVAKAYDIIKLIIDLETTNSSLLGEIALKVVTERFGENPEFKNWLRIIGLRGLENFQGSVRNCELLAHMEPGKFVFHSGGWGTGELIDISPIREQVSIEFENVQRRRDLSFENAFKTLIPLPNDHFLSRRFGNPDQLESEARKDPSAVIRLLLRDLGPQTAADIKEELCEWVIPEEDWSKWWQTARNRLKKDTFIHTPSNLKEPFRLHETEVTHEERFQKEIHHASDIDEIILTSYNYIRDFPNLFRTQEAKQDLLNKIMSLLEDESLEPHQELEVAIFAEQLLGQQLEGYAIRDLVKKLDPIKTWIDKIDILAFKKRALQSIRKHREDWPELFVTMLFSRQHGPIRDYVFSELNQGETVPLVKQNLKDMIEHPERSPEAFVWYFQKLIGTKEDIPYSEPEGNRKFLESLLILLSKIEFDDEYRDLSKKIYQLLTGKRFGNVRTIIEGASETFLSEFLLLVSKCRTLTTHDIKIMNSLAQVVAPNVGKKEEVIEESIIWTTEEGFQKAKQRAEEIEKVELQQNTKEVKTARALGDLRENAEYKSALEQRSRLQGELKSLMESLNIARVITPQDIHTQEVGVGNVVTLHNAGGEKITYTILGPWDANPDENILSFHSKLSQAMIGKSVGDTFEFRDEKYTIEDIKSYL